MNSYGKDLDCGVDFADLIRMVNDIPGDFLIRFMTSHPKDATEKLFRTMAECEKCAHQLHLPVQSGSDRILKAMNRSYTREKYLEQVALARQYMPDLVLTTDIIVGFPGETEEEFADTLSLVRAGALRRHVHLHLLQAGGHPGGLHARPLHPGRQAEAF